MLIILETSNISEKFPMVFKVIRRNNLKLLRVFLEITSRLFFKVIFKNNVKK